MHHQSVFSPTRILRAVFCAAALLLLAGCDIKVVDLTPKVLPENPSRIYTFGLRAEPKSTKVLMDSISARLVVDGQTFEMKTGALGAGIFEYEYQLPAGRDELAYYYIVDYAVENRAGISRRREYGEITRTRVVGRYVFTMETNRGPVGARISVVGRGFGNADVVRFDDQPVRTVNESVNALSFYVPAVETGRNYRVTLVGAAGTSPIGTFRVDPAVLSVSPERLALTQGGSQSLTFTLPAPAPFGGQMLDITTDVPDSVIMPEVLVPEGQNTITVDVTGGKPGSGNLFLKGYGSTGEITVPVTVQ
ncbi:MAG: cell surface protein [Opitutaceae bacterium]|jgi:hypothetical protein|nr:cell surface protein [Opitutaceae bacterium]